MAIAVDDTAVARATANNSATTGSFTPPANRLLVACVSSDGDPPTIGVSSSPALTWTLQPQATNNNGGAARTAVAEVSTSQSYTVTATNSNSGRVSVKVYVVSGHDSASPVGATFASTSAVNNWFPSYTSTVDNSRGFGCSTDWNALGAPTSADTEDAFHVNGFISGLSAYKAADTATSGTVVTINSDAAAGTPQWSGAGVEIKPAAAGGVTGTALISGGGTLTASGKRTVEGASAVSGGGSVTAAGKRTVYGTTSAVPSWLLTASGTSATPGSAAVLGGGLIAAQGDRTVSALTPVAGGGLISANGVVGGAGVLGSGEVLGGGTLAALGKLTVHGVSLVESVFAADSFPKRTVKALVAVAVEAGIDHTEPRRVDIRPRRGRLFPNTIFPERWPPEG